MKLPKKIKIGARWHKVIFPHKYESGYDAKGTISHIDGNIKLIGDYDGAQYSADNVWQTFIHEIIHQIGRITQTEVLADDEKTIKRVSETILAILIDNKWLEPEI